MSAPVDDADTGDVTADLTTATDLRSADPTAAGGDEEVFDLRLYVAGHSPRSVRAIDNLRRVCEEYLAGRYRVQVIDLLENPRLARGEEIIAVPTLVRKLPEPIRTLIGDLSDTDQVLVGLQLRPEGWRSA